MRFIGNKSSILNHIENLLREKNLLSKQCIFFDAFCGTGSVANFFKQYYDLIINDNLKWAITYTNGRICASSCHFNHLGFDPFLYFNNSENVRHDFIYKNYSHSFSSRMYFTTKKRGKNRLF